MDHGDGRRKKTKRKKERRKGKLDSPIISPPALAQYSDGSVTQRLPFFCPITLDLLLGLYNTALEMKGIGTCTGDCPPAARVLTSQTASETGTRLELSVSQVAPALFASSGLLIVVSLMLS